MTQATIDRRTAENQVAFRAMNELVYEGLREFRAIADEEGYDYKAIPSNTTLQFKCECSDVDCHRRIKLSLANYAHIHENRNHFTICLHHELPSIEFVYNLLSKYQVVEKFIKPSEEVRPLFPAHLHNI